MNTNQKLLLTSVFGVLLVVIGLVTPGFDMGGFLLLSSVAFFPLVGIAYNLLGEVGD